MQVVVDRFSLLLLFLLIRPAEEALLLSVAALPGGPQDEDEDGDGDCAGRGHVGQEPAEAVLQRHQMIVVVLAAHQGNRRDCQVHGLLQQEEEEAPVGQVDEEVVQVGVHRQVVAEAGREKEKDHRPNVYQRNRWSEKLLAN